MSPQKYSIKAWCRIENNSIITNRGSVGQYSSTNFDTFADSAYKFIEMGYSKFHKMDKLSKLGMLSAEALLKDISFKESFKSEEIGIILSNSSSSLDTDIRYYNMVKKGIASPAIFVYTLPNIMIGEICIRHGIKGENTYFISESKNLTPDPKYINSLLDSRVMETCICGSVELFEDAYHSFMYLVGKNTEINELLHTKENIEKILLN